MNYQDKTKEELITELQDLQLENRILKLSLENNTIRNSSSADNSKQEYIDIHDSKEHFELIFDTSPDAALITRLSDGMAIEVNEGFTKLTGFTREETLGVSTIAIKLWKDPEDRKLIVNELLKNGFCENLEMTFVRKNGSFLIGLVSSKAVMLHGVPHIFSIVRDITERKLAEKALKQSEEKFRSLYANMIDGSALHTLLYNEEGDPEDYLINDVNPAFESLLGISRETVLNKTSREAYGVDVPPYLEIYSRVALTGEPEIFESYFAPLDKHFSISVYCPFKGSFATIFENITERKKAEQALRIALTKYQVLFDIFPVGITITDTGGKIIESNQIAESLLGISREEQEKRKIDGEEWGIIRPDGTTMPATEFPSVKALELNSLITNIEMGIVKGDKQVTWLSVSATPIPIEGFGVAIVYSNITERKKAEHEKERTQKLLEDSQRIGKIGGWEINIDTMELKWTKEMYAIHEVDLSFLPNIDIRAKFYTPESLPAVDAAVQRAIQHGESYDIDSEIITAKGNRKTIKAIGKADLENRRVFGFFQDITERKKFEAQLLAQTNNLKELNASKDKFFSIIAHDLKSPFIGILGFTELLKNEVRDLDIESIEDYVNIIHSSAQHTFELLDTLLEWARIQQGAIPFEPKTILLNTLIDSGIEGLRPNADQKKIDLQNCLKENIITYADEEMIGSVIRNLISNAIKFTPKNGTVKINAQINADQLEISVSDTGIGMSNDKIGKLFRIETSFTTRGTENEKGTGLGLLLCKEFVEIHGGIIRARSIVGQGSEFIFSIPYRD